MVIGLFIGLSAQVLGTSASSTENYEVHAPIYIVGNNQFHDMALAEQWTGDGTETQPYVIEGLSITGRTNLIEIRDTDVFFQIMNNFLSQGFNGIVLRNVQHGLLSGNHIVDSLTHRQAEGCHGADLSGMQIRDSSNIAITGNVISQNQVGLYVLGGSQIHVTQNQFISNFCYGSVLSAGTVDSSLTFNSFIDNRQGTLNDYTVPTGPQAYTDAPDQNTIELNYFNDAPVVDTNQDDIIDTPYVLAGATGATDNYPRVSAEVSPSLPEETPSLPEETPSLPEDSVSLELVLMVSMFMAVSGLVLVLFIKKTLLSGSKSN